MPWCPKCKTEYAEGTKVCADCGGPLCEGEPEEESARDGWVEDEPALLTSTDDRLDSEMLEGSLRSAGIPFLAKNHNDAGFMRVYMGGSWTGSDYYVPSRLLERARALIPGAPAEPSGDAGQPRPSGPPPCEPQEKPHRAGTVIVALVAALALFGYFCFEALLNFLRKAFGF